MLGGSGWMLGSISIFRGCSDLEQPPSDECPGSAFQQHLDNALEHLGSLEGLRLLGWMDSIGCSDPQACVHKCFPFEFSSY